MKTVGRLLADFLPVAALALVGVLFGGASPAVAATRAPTAGPCYNVVNHDGDTTHIEVYYLCNSMQVKSTRAWLTKPIRPTDAGHFELRNGAGAYANSDSHFGGYWTVSHQFVNNHGWTSHRGELVCVNFWIDGLHGPRKSGGTNCVTS
jgi:hypothetical protein